MQLSSELQQELQRINSPVKLASALDGTFPASYAFLGRPGRSFRTEFASGESEFSIVLFEKTDALNYENCFARGIVRDLTKLAGVIDLWVAKSESIGEIHRRFGELEIYEEFEYKNANKDIDKAWEKVRNMFFNSTTFWNDPVWSRRYFEMLDQGKQHKLLQNLYPFTSHYWLRFSTDKDLHETRVPGIIPTVYSKEVPATLPAFYVSYDLRPMGGSFFETAKEAVDFLSARLSS